MIGLLFLISLICLVLSLIASSWIRKYHQICKILVVTFFGTTLFLLIAMMFQYFLAKSMSFLNPGFFILLILPLAILIVHLYATKRFTPRLQYPLTHFLPETDSISSLLARWGQLLCTLIALVLFIIALARPVIVNKKKLPPTQGIDIMMVLDASASMNRNDFYPTRFAAAQKNAIRFIGKRFNDRIGLTLFGKNATLAAPLTLDHEALQELVASLYLGLINGEATAIGDALGVASKHLKDSTAKSKIILLLTDGSNNAGSLDPLLAAKAAAAYGIKIYTIATASPPGETLVSSLEDEIDEGLLMNIAKETGGHFYRAKNERELQQIYDKINELEKTEFTQSASVQHYDIFTPFLLAGIVLLMLGILVGKLLFIKVP